MNLMQIIQQAQQLKQNTTAQNANADPRQIIQKLMNEGKVSQQQYNSALQMARSLGVNI